MTEEAAPYESLAQASRTKDLRRARSILWIVGLLTFVVNGFHFATAEKSFDRAVEQELRGEGLTLEEVRNRPPEERAEFDEEYEKGLQLARLITGGSALLGLCFIACAMMVFRKPVAATVTGLVLYLGGTAAILAIDPPSIARGLLFKILIVIGLASAVKAALAYERSARAAAAP